MAVVYEPRCQGSKIWVQPLNQQPTSIEEKFWLCNRYHFHTILCQTWPENIFISAHKPTRFNNYQLELLLLLGHFNLCLSIYISLTLYLFAKDPEAGIGLFQIKRAAEKSNKYAQLQCIGGGGIVINTTTYWADKAFISFY